MNLWWAQQEWPCVCNRGDRWMHTHYPSQWHRCARCTECEGYRPDIPEQVAIRMLLGPVMSDDEAATILLGHTTVPDPIARVTAWLSNGGFFNPDVMARCHPDQTRDLILDLRNALAAASVRPVERVWFCQQCPETFTDTRLAAAHSRHTYHVITSQPPNTPRGSPHARSEDA